MRDLRGGKASEDSLTILMANLVVAYAVDFQSGPSLSVALDPTVRSDGSGRSVCALPVSDCEGSETILSVSRGITVRRITLSEVVHVPSSSGFCGVEGMYVGKIEDPIPRFGSEWCIVTRSTRLPSTALPSLWTLLRARRYFCGRRRRSRIPISSLGSKSAQMAV